jgi:hypothetical protein
VVPPEPEPPEPLEPLLEPDEVLLGVAEVLVLVLLLLVLLVDDELDSLFFVEP